MTQLPEPDPEIIWITKVVITQPDDATPTTTFARDHDELSVDVSWQVKLPKLPIYDGVWRLNFFLQSLTPGGSDHNLADIFVPAVPDLSSYTEKARLYIGNVAAGIYRLVTSVTYFNTKNSPMFVAFDEQMLQILPD